MSTTKRILVLTGGRTGHSCTLDRMYKFRDGKMTLFGSTPDVEALTKHLGRSYAAYPEDSIELAAAQRLDAERGEKEKADGEHHHAKAEERNAKQRVPADVRPDGPGTPAEEATEGPGSADIVEGQEGSADSGDGREDSRVSRIREAVMSLEVPNDELWTVDGLPKVEAVIAALGEDVTRAEITAAAPDFNRQLGNA